MRNKGTVGLAVIMALACIAGCTTKVEVEKSIEINAPVEVVYAHVADLQKVNLWNPWAMADPTMQITYGATTVGEGATYSWTGEDSGEGTVTITKAIPNQRVETEISFGDMGGGQGYYIVEPTDSGARLTQVFKTEMSSLWAGMVEDDANEKFATGQAKLKEILEAGG